MIRLFTFLTLCLFFVVTGKTQPGQLDPSFADDGVLLMNLEGDSHDIPNELVVQPDNKIVLGLVTYFETSGFAAMRFHENGDVDSTFANNGFFYHENNNGADLLYDMALLDDGSILMSGGYAQGPADQDMYILKLTSEGVLDSMFGVDGVVLLSIGDSREYAREMAITSDGQIAICGYTVVPGGSGKQAVMIVLNHDGSLDTDFGTDGIFIWNSPDISTEMYSLVIDADGNYLVAGFTRPAGTNRIVVYKVLADGSGLDTTFGNNGEVLTFVEGKGSNIQIHQNGNILVTGSATSPVGGTSFVVLAFRDTGLPSTEFGEDGTFTHSVYPNNYGASMAIQTDGKIIVAGEAGFGPIGLIPSHFTTIRCDADGVLDETWGDMGAVETFTHEPGYFAFINSVKIQPSDGKVLVTGPSGYPGGHDLTIVRYGNYIDADEDGSPLGEDCNDANADIFPDNEEIVYNGIDDDCDPATLDDDLDQDGFVLADDCDDMNAAISPDNVEIVYNGIDDDCDPATLDDDLDQDGFVLADDCDDMNADINPDAIDILDNGIDEDCDGMDNITSVRESALSSQFSVFPNPASEAVFIRYEATDIQLLSIQITDVSGRQLAVQSNYSSLNQVEISLTDLPSGMLVLKIETEKGVAVKRIVKK